VNLDVEYSVRRSDRARRARIQVTADGVEVVVPRRLSMREVEPFIAEKKPWIERTLRRLREAEAERPATELEDGGQVPYMGEMLLLRVKIEPSRTRAHVARRGEVLVVKVAEAGSGAVADALEGWYRKRARAEVEPRLDAACARAGTGYSKLSIRAQRTRWASCSSSGAMSFNWRLLLAPPQILDYVVEHEVCHLTVHDHSRRFWNLLAARMPEYREHERWLKRHGPSLKLP
jgi:predicted metal-dependent hydrolase